MRAILGPAERPVPHRWLRSAFIVLNLATLAYVNLPPGVRDAGERAVWDLPAVTRGAVRVAAALGRVYAGLSGQNNTWGLFVHIPRVATRTAVRAEYADGTVVTLPLPLQSERTFWRRRFFDLKETRLLRSQETSAEVRHACADFLCRRYPEHDGSPVRAVAWYGESLNILPPREAEAAGTHLGPPVWAGVIERVPCRPAAE